jgi:hypothetical protein
MDGFSLHLGRLSVASLECGGWQGRAPVSWS